MPLVLQCDFKFTVITHLLTALAKTRYEQLKKATQTELKQTLDQLLEGDDKVSLLYIYGHILY